MKNQNITKSETQLTLENRVERIMREIRFTEKFCETELRIFEKTLNSAMNEVARTQATEIANTISRNFIK